MNRRVHFFLMAIAASGVAGLFAADQKTPSDLFLKKCAKCHGETGRADTPKGKKLMAQDFTDPDFQQHKSDAQMIEAITNGTDKDMPAFGKVLSPEEIRSLIPSVRSFGRR